MTTELTALPESFAAGTTVTYRRQLSDYPASGGWTLKLYLAGASTLEKAAAADGDDHIVTLAAADTSGSFAAGLYKWAERVSHTDGRVYEVASGVVTVLPDLTTATDGGQQEWLERAITAHEPTNLVVPHEGRLPAGMESYQIAGRAVSKIPVKEAVDLLTSLESRLARLANPDAVTRQVLVSFSETGFDT